MQLDRRKVVACAGALSLAPAVSRAQSAPNNFPPRVALTVGVQAYRELGKLTRSAADAQAMASRLQAIGYEAHSVIDPDRKALQAAVEAFIARIGPQTSAIFFFAGHGFQSGGENYLTACDTRPTEQEIYGSSYALSDVLGRMVARAPRQGIIILDACRNPLGTPAAIAQRQGFSGIQAPNGFFVVYSAGSGEYALDDLGRGDTNPNSVFTRTFLKYLNPNVTIAEIVQASKAEVIRLAAGIAHPQHPATYDQTSSEFTLAGDRVQRRTSAFDRVASFPRTRAFYVVHETDGQTKTLHAGPARSLGQIGAQLDFRAGMINPGLPWLRKHVGYETDSEYKDFDTMILCWAGLGGYVQQASAAREAMFLIPLDDDGRIAPQLLSVGQLIDMVKAPGRKVIILADIPLQKIEVSRSRELHFAGSGVTLRSVAAVPETRALEVLMDSGLDETSKEQVTGSVAVLFGSSLGAATPNVTVGESASPFSTAIGNALQRPGLPLKDFASAVRKEVEEITGGRQSPWLVGTQSAITKPFSRWRQVIRT